MKTIRTLIVFCLCVLALFGFIRIYKSDEYIKYDNHRLPKAVESRDYEDVLSQLRSGADTEIRVGYGYTPMYIAISNNDYDSLSNLIHFGGNVNATVSGRATPLIMIAVSEACYRIRTGDKLRIVNELIDNGADVNATDYEGESALMVAANCGKSELVEKLLISGAEPNIVSDRGETALRNAVYVAWRVKNEESLSIVQKIVSYGGSPRKSLKLGDWDYSAEEAIKRLDTHKESDLNINKRIISILETSNSEKDLIANKSPNKNVSAKAIMLQARLYNLGFVVSIDFSELILKLYKFLLMIPIVIPIILGLTLRDNSLIWVAAIFGAGYIAFIFFMLFYFIFFFEDS